MTEQMSAIARKAFIEEIQKLAGMSQSPPELPMLFDYLVKNANSASDMKSSLLKLLKGVKRKNPLIKTARAADIAERLLRTGIATGKTAIPVGTTAGYGVKKTVDFLGKILTRPDPDRIRSLTAFQREFVSKGVPTARKIQLEKDIKNLTKVIDTERALKQSKVENISTAAGLGAGLLAGGATAFERARSAYPLMHSSRELGQIRRNVLIGSGAAFGGLTGGAYLSHKFGKSSNLSDICARAFKDELEKMAQDYEPYQPAGMNPLLKAGLGAGIGGAAGHFGGPKAGAFAGNILGRSKVGIAGKLPFVGGMFKDMAGRIGASKGAHLGGRYGAMAGLGLGTLAGLLS